MSFLQQQLKTITANAPLNRRQALLGLSIFTLAACSRSAREAKPDAGGNVAYYTCTMHPFVRSQDPKGKCPICGMDLVPVLKSAGDSGNNSAGDDSASTPVEAAGIVNVAPERLQQIGVTTELVALRKLTRMLHAPARAEVDESSLRDINVKAGSGYITKLHANYVGMAFHKGDPLMTVLCEGWLQTQIDYIQAYRSWKQTPLMSQYNSGALMSKLELMRARIRVWDLSEDQLHDLEKFAITTNESDLRTGHGLSGSFDVLAPFDGYVHEKKAIEGMRFEAGQSLLEVADHSHAWIVAQFPEDQAMYLDLGQKMTVTFPSMPQHKVTGEISFIDPHVDDAQRRIVARLIVPDKDSMFHPGLFADVTGEVPVGERLSVSAGAVVPTGTKYIVFVDHGGGKLEPRPIEVGIHSGDYLEVVSGLKEGDRVVSSAAFLIDAESRIQGVLKTWGDTP